MSITNINAGQAVVKIIGDNTELRQMLEQQTTDLDKFARKWTNIGARLQAAGQMMFAPFQEAMRVFADFDDQMRRVAAVSGATGQAFSMLTKQAKALGASTAFTASQVAAGMASLGMMGFSPDEISGAMESVMALSRATSTDLAEAASIAANQLRVFGLSAADTGKVADILAATANGSAQTLTDLGEALKMAGPIAKITGQDLKQVTGALGVLANMGIRGSQAGTAIARSYKQMADPKVQQYMKSLGVDVPQANGQLRNMAEIWADLGKRLATMTNAEQLAALKEIFGDRGILGGGVLSFNPQAIDAFMAKLRQCDGYVSDTAETMEGGLGGALRNLSSAWEAVKIAAGEAISAFSPLVRFCSLLTRGFAKLLEATGPLVPALGGVAAAILAIGAAMSHAGLIASVLGLTKAVAGLKAAWVALAANPVLIGLAATAGAIVVATKALTYTMDRATNQAIDAAHGVLDSDDEPTDEAGIKRRLKAISSARQRLAEEMNKMSNGVLSKVFRGAAEANVKEMKGEFDALSQEYDRQLSRLEELKRERAAFEAAGGVAPEAAERAGEITSQLADERLTQVEREIAANEELRKELLEVYKAQLQYARLRGDRSASAVIRTQIADANAQFDARRADIVARGAKSAGIIDVSADQQKRSEARAKATAEARQERLLDALRDSSPADYQAKLQQLITEATDAVSIAAKALADEQSQATLAGSEGGEGITDAEKAAIDAQRELYEEAQKHLDKLQGKLDNAETNPETLSRVAEQANGKSVGSFSAAALNRLMGNGGVQERIANATRRTAEYLARITELNRQKLTQQKELNNSLGMV